MTPLTVIVRRGMRREGGGGREKPWTCRPGRCVYICVCVREREIEKMYERE